MASRNQIAASFAKIRESTPLFARTLKWSRHAWGKTQQNARYFGSQCHSGLLLTQGSWLMTSGGSTNGVLEHNIAMRDGPPWCSMLPQIHFRLPMLLTVGSINPLVSRVRNRRMVSEYVLPRHFIDFEKIWSVWSLCACQLNVRSLEVLFVFFVFHLKCCDGLCQIG